MKNSTIFVLVLILLIIGGVYLISNNKIDLSYKNSEKSVTIKPVTPPTPLTYPEGYPKELVFDTVKLDQSSKKTLDNGKIQMTIEFITNNPTEDISGAYKAILKSNGWIIKDSTDDNITATKKGAEVLVTLTSKDTKSTAVIVQYQK